MASSAKPPTEPAPAAGRRRVVIERVKPEIDCGRFPAKAIVDEPLVVEADIFTDGHDALSAALLHRAEGEDDWTEASMEPLVNDRWRAHFTPTRLGIYRYTLTARVDMFKSWRRDLVKRVDAGQDVSTELRVGARLVAEAGERAAGGAERLKRHAAALLSDGAVAAALDDGLAELMACHPDQRFATTYSRELAVVVDRERARFGAWYEMFPRSAAAEAGEHGSFRDCEARLPYIADMGFDVLYLPPIHPIGRTHRKGRNNEPVAEAGDVGSPWAIGAEEGGHKSVHPRLGTLEDFRRLVGTADDHGIEVALDVAFQASPDHPCVDEHPEWFRHRPDGTIQCAENPPKKYEDIYPFDFESPEWRRLWRELRSVFEFWIEQGVSIFRVDNPHTKPFAFWERVIAEVKAEHPEVIFLAEAFTRPKVMARLAKLGFTQSYTYFAWRNARWELTEYLTELTQTEASDYFRPNFWPNTPDILTEYLQTGGRPAFMIRLVLAATLAASYGIYGPPFELLENEPREEGSEEYLDSEKYQLRHWALDRPESLADFIARVNAIRRDNPALHSNRGLCFHPVENDELIAYSKRDAAGSNLVLVVVDLDPHHTQSGWIELPLVELGLDPDERFQVHDLLGGARYLWHGGRNYVELNPHVVPAHVFRIGRRARTETDFEYYG